MENIEKKPNIFSKIGKGLYRWGRKQVISLKRNYFIVPMLFILIAFIQFTCNLFILSPNAILMYPTINDLFLNPGNFPTFNLDNYTFQYGVAKVFSLLIFVITLLSILYTVSFIFFMQNRNNGKKKWFFFGLFFLLSLSIVVLEIFLKNATILARYIYEYDLSKAIELGEDTEKIISSINGCNNVDTIFTVNIILICIACVAAATSPLCQNLVKKIKYKRMSIYEEK